MVRSSRNTRTSRRSVPSSARSSVVSAPVRLGPWSISCCVTHRRRADSVRSNSRATCPMLRSCCTQSRTASRLNSSVNRRRARLPMNTSRRILAPSSVSTKPREDQVDSVFLVAVHPASDGEYEELESIGHALRLLGVRIDRASEIRDPRPLCCTLRGYTSSRILGVGSGEMNFPPNPSCLNFAASSTPMCQESSNCTSSAEVRRHHRR